MISEVPAETPVTTPVDSPIVATPVVALLQIPPVVVFASVVVAPAQTDSVPVITGKTGSATTVSDCCL